MSKLQPRLIVKGAHAAIAFYVEALGAKVTQKFVDRKLGDLVVHCELTVGESSFSLGEENPEWQNHGPTSLGGSPVILGLTVDDADAFGARMVQHGSTVVFPIADQFYGIREGRLRDPFGHLWIISQVTEKLSDDEVQRRVDRFHD